MRYEIYQDRAGQWRWRLKARNGKILAVSSEGYVSELDCLECIEYTKGSRTAPVVEV